MNLLANAHIHGRDGGIIRLSLEPRGDQAWFAVADDGPGIPLADQARLFERFYRSEKEGVRMSQGSGLGLPIAKALVELHGGRIWVESRPGTGATFWVTLPIEPSAAIALARTAGIAPCSRATSSPDSDDEGRVGCSRDSKRISSA